MLSTEDILLLISKQFSIYVSLSILIGGVTCNILNIIIFTQLTIFRRHQSTFYFICGSIVDCIQLLSTFTSRVNFYAFHYDPTQTSLVWCKMRVAIAQTCAIVSMGTVCSASIDQYLSTNHHARIRQMSTLKLAHRFTFILVCFALLHAILFLIFYEIDPKFGCIPQNPVFVKYLSFVHFCILIGLLPTSISSTFALLAFLNVRRITRRQVRIVRRRLDRQLTAMVLIRVCLLTITVVPFTAYQIYQLNVSSNLNNTLGMAINQLIGAISYSICFLNYSSSFYVFLVSSTRFRRQVKYFLFKKLWRQCCLKTNSRNTNVRRNQIAAISYCSVKEID